MSKPANDLRICRVRFLGQSLVPLVAAVAAALSVAVGCGRLDAPGEANLRQSQSLQMEALAARQPNARTLFEELPPEHSGVRFQISWEKPAEFDRVFYAQNTGGGVSIGDYDQDGRPDLYLTSPSGGNRLYQNLGDFRFRDVTEAAGLRDDEHWGTGATFVDIDNDGDLDIYVCGYHCSNKLYVNHGDGTFTEQAKSFGLDFHGASVMMAFADYDRDGDLDGYLLTAGIQPGPKQKFRVRFEGNKPVIPEDLQEYWQLLYLPGERAKQIEAGQFDHLYRNNGDGSFTDVTKGAGITGTDFGQAAQWWDYNADGWPDLYVANDFWGPDYLYRNNGDGTFTDMAKTALPHTPWSSMGVDIADINNDGLFDLMATDMSGTNHYNQKVGMGDMSGGWFLEYPTPRQYMRNSVYINTAGSRFMEVAHLAGLADTDWTWTPRFDDLDNDGLVDLFVSNGMTRDFTNSDLNETAKKVAREGTPEFFRFWREQPLRKDRNLAFKNCGDLAFQDVGAQWGLNRLGTSFGAATGDLDGDGDLDLVVNNMDTYASLYRNGSVDGNLVKIRLRGSTGNRFGIGSTIRIHAGQATQVRYLVHARGWTSCGEPIVHFGLGSAERIDRLTIQWPSGHVQQFDGLPANRLYTIDEPTALSPPEPHVTQPDALTSRATMFVRSDVLDGVRHQEQPYDEFARQPLLPNRLSQLGPGMAWGDIDGDGDDDLYVSGAKGQSGQLVVQETPGKFVSRSQTVFAASQDVEEMAPLFFDADGDDDLDLYVVSGGVECEAGAAELADRLYLNDGHGRFQLAPPEALPDVRDSGSTVVAVDFDQDGDLDLFVGSRSVPGRYPETPDSRLLRNESGRFVEVTDELAPGLRRAGMASGALWSDVDGDRWIDLLVAYEWGPIRLYRNHEGKLVDETERAGLAQRLGWWNGIAGGDLDHDGDVDYVVTNFGLNTKYHDPNPEHPVKLFYGDFDGSGNKQIVEAKGGQGGLVPVRGKSCSQNAMPVLRERFPTYHSFAISSLAAIYTPQCLAEALELEVNCLRSGVLVNDGTGRFTFESLPRLAQASPGFGALITDANGDGHADIYLVQNFYGPQRETGRMDGGVSLLLLGNGDARQLQFTPVWPHESGLLVPGDAKSLTSSDVDGDGWSDMVVGVNDEGLAVFTRKVSDESIRPLTIRFKGPRGNSTAAGARVVAHWSDGAASAWELCAGSGYLSQSSPRVTLANSDGRSVDKLTVQWPGRDAPTSVFNVPKGLGHIVISHPRRPTSDQASRHK